MKTAIIFIWLRESRVINAIEMTHALAGTDDLIIYTEKCDLRYSAAVNWNRAIDKVAPLCQNICIMGDDCLPQKDWLKNALAAMATLPGGWGMVNLNDGTGIDRTSHVVFDKRCLDLLDGKLLHEGYFFCCSDMEMMDRMRESGHYIFAPDAIAVHYHPMLFKDAPNDQFYDKAYSHEQRLADRALYETRNLNGWKNE